MGLVPITQGGIHSVQYEADEGAVKKHLKRLDPALRLVWQVDEARQMKVWKVYAFVSNDRPAVWITDWRGDDGTPLPLTSALVDHVRSLQAGTRKPMEDVLAANDALEAANRKEWQEMLEQQIKDGERRLRTSPAIHPSPALAAARARGRRKGLSK